MIDSSQSSSTRPYLLRALYEWCADNGLTPYIAAYVDDAVKVPTEHVKNNEIVLNISMDATSNLKIGNDVLTFKARFGGQAREIVVPIDHVIAIYARENGQGMAFPVPQAMQPVGEVAPKPPVGSKSAQGLRSVQSSPAEAVTSLKLTAAQANVVKLKGVDPASALLQPYTGDATAAEVPSTGNPNEDPSGGTPNGKGKNAGRPSLTRVK